MSRTGRQRPAPLSRRIWWRYDPYALFRTPRALHDTARKTNVTMHTLIEETRVKQRQHRCTGSQEYGFTTRDVDADQVGGQSEDDQCHLCLMHLEGGDSVNRIDLIVDKFLTNCH